MADIAKPTGTTGDDDQRDNVEETKNTTEEISNDVEQPENTDEEGDEEGAVGIRSSPPQSPPSASSSSSDSDEVLGVSRACNATDPNCDFVECAVHKELCDSCDTHCLEPDDDEQRRLHRAVCKKNRFFERQYTIAVTQSYNKVCGICMEVVMNKRPRDQRFGLLPNCMHVFCLRCIRNWRRVKTQAPAVRQGCPMCRVVSYFVCPSFVWYENAKEKWNNIALYITVCGTIPCKYLRQDGRRKCPFGKKCFYQHTPADTH
uniref:RING-type E3 ubiquitin transferase n=1 Tax=Anopheles maculatus TaxID=74869 RepID=A0A182SBD7_9DIPT